MAKSPGGQGVVLGYLKYVLGFDSLAFQEGLGDADKRLKAAQKSLQKTADKFTNIGATLSVGITAPFTALMTAAIPAATESRQALAQVNAALTSMGDASGRTSEQLQKAAGHLQDISNFDDDDILKSVTANLLTFGNVSGDVFDRAQLAAVNLSARLGQDLQSSAIQLGKALNDPIKGITALQRVGVSFTESQREQIKAMVETGNTAGAQKLILGELEKQFGGAAEAQRKATPTAEQAQAWRTFQETIGEMTLKVLPPLTSLLTGVLNAFNQLSPTMQTVVVGAAAIAAGLGPVALGIGGIISGVGLALPALTGLAVFFSGTLIPVLATVGRALIGLAIAGGPLTLIAAAVGAVYAVWKNWDTIGPIVQRVYTAVKTWIFDKLNALWDTVIEKLKIVGDSFYTLYDRVVGHSYVPDMVSDIGDWFSKLGRLMVDPALAATSETASAFANMASGVINNFQSMLRALKSGDIGGFAGGLSSIIGTVGGLFGGGGQTAAQIGFNDYGRTGLPKLAGGGLIKGLSGIDRNVLSINGREAAMVGRGEMLRVEPNNDNGGRRAISVHVEPSPYFDVRVQEVSGPLVQQGMVGAVGMSEQRSAKRARRRL